MWIGGGMESSVESDKMVATRGDGVSATFPLPRYENNLLSRRVMG